MRLVRNMTGIFYEMEISNIEDAVCGFYWLSSGTAVLEFGINGTSRTQYGCADLNDTCQIQEQDIGLIPDISIDAENPGEICYCPAVSDGGRGEFPW